MKCEKCGLNMFYRAEDASHICVNGECDNHNICFPVPQVTSDSGTEDMSHYGDGNVTADDISPCLSDSGVKETFPSGYHRDSRKGKGRYDLIPPRPIHLLACVFEDGGNKHGDRNWEKGGAVDSFIDCALRHINKYQAGMRGQPHLTQAAWNIIAGLEMAIRADDISKYERERLAKFEEEDK